MTEELSFELTEWAFFSNTTSWRLNGNEIRFRGTSAAGDPLPAIQPIPAREEQIARFVLALDFLDVWTWKASYDPIECGCTISDGMTWSIKASMNGRRCNSGGDNAFPSFADPRRASLDVERYGFSDLHFALISGSTSFDTSSRQPV